MIEADFGRVITKHNTTIGTIYMFDLIPSMWAVMVFDAESQIILSRTFPYTEKTEKTSFAHCRTFYKKVKDILLVERNLDAIEELL
jgi:hypothetical protein